MKWEYLVVFLGLDRQKDLNVLGLHGWELVAVIFENKDELPTAYLKRPAKPPPVAVTVSMNPGEAIKREYRDD